MTDPTNAPKQPNNNLDKRPRGPRGRRYGRQPVWEYGRRDDWSREWGMNKRRGIFLRFLAMFGFMTVLVLGGMGAVAFILSHIITGDGSVAALVWVGGCSLAIALPMLAGAIARSAFRGIASPLAEVMSAAEKIGGGDLSVRVSENHSGQFHQMATTFNQMASELERSDEQRKNLTADIAHELRTPLHILQGNLEGILDGVYQPNEAFVAEMLDETRLLSRLVDDLRLLSQAEAGELSLRRELMDVGEIITDLETSFRGQAEAAGITFETITENPLPQIEADPDRMAQVLGNLLANAIRHTPRGESVRLMAAKNGNGIVFEVSDTGEGISAEDLPFIFDRFWRGDRARTHRSGVGGGLGLAISRQLVQAHNGTIDVHSQLGKGTTFEIHLPIAAPQDAELI